MKYINKNNLRVIIADLKQNHLDYKKALQRSYNHLGVVINADCEKVGSIINEVPNYFRIFTRIYSSEGI